MKSISFSEFRSHASGLLNDVAKGETLVLLRHGKPVAEVVPVRRTGRDVPSWKRPGLRLARTGTALSHAILDDRSE